MAEEEEMDTLGMETTGEPSLSPRLDRSSERVNSPDSILPNLGAASLSDAEKGKTPGSPAGNGNGSSEKAAVFFEGVRFDYKLQVCFLIHLILFICLFIYIYMLYCFYLFI